MKVVATAGLATVFAGLARVGLARRSLRTRTVLAKGLRADKRRQGSMRQVVGHVCHEENGDKTCGRR